MGRAARRSIEERFSTRTLMSQLAQFLEETLR
jgi:hypothetical protein